MIEIAPARLMTCFRRELQEYRNSLVRTPIAITVLLALMVLISVLMANRISAMGDAMLKVVMQEESISGMNITITIDEDGEDVAQAQEFQIEYEQGPVAEEEWDFSKEWNFSPSASNKSPESGSRRIDGLNPMFNMIHNLMLLVMGLVTVNYLLGTLYNDRRDRSILFWKSLPVSEWEEVLAKFLVALVVTPIIYIGLSMLAQLICSLLAMLLVWRMDKDPFEVVLGNIEYSSLFLNQIVGWIQMALVAAPLYAWMLLASAAARRSPFLFAVAPVLALLILEKVFLGGGYVLSAIINHLPHWVATETAVGVYTYGPGWTNLNWWSVLLGWLFTAAALTGAVYLRRYRFEI